MQVKLLGLDKVLKSFNTFPDAVKREVGFEFREAAKEIEQIAKRNAPHDQGRLSNAISTKEIEVAKYEVVAQDQISPMMEFGTGKSVKVDPEFATYAMTFKGQKVTGSGTLSENILAWVKRTGLAGTYSIKTRKRIGGKNLREQQDKTAAFLISRKIARDGVKPHPYLLPAFKEVKPRLIKRLIQLFRK